MQTWERTDRSHYRGPRTHDQARQRPRRGLRLPAATRVPQPSQELFHPLRSLTPPRRPWKMPRNVLFPAVHPRPSADRRSAPELALRRLVHQSLGPPMLQAHEMQVEVRNQLHDFATTMLGAPRRPLLSRHALVATALLHQCAGSRIFPAVRRPSPADNVLRTPARRVSRTSTPYPPCQTLVAQIMVALRVTPRLAYPV
ncbi:hypothetical protein AURDEDRAFT_187272 [Auricularia subglabra TFB-10046 SS5]|nr:hypothetical protein AURDEDRAFT_187272 [Auricularia subglabra TFB-10046 SS5]